MDRRQFLATLGAGALPAQTGARKPNILFILADDLGYGDLGCYGQQQIPTPRLDRLASEGTRFTDAYAGSTVCAPSRCALMTGLHMGHARIRGNARVPLEPADTTIAKLLQPAGYRTGLIGKWGLGNAGTSGIPNLQGFDEFFGYLDQQHAHTYYPDHLWENRQERILARNIGLKQEYSHDLFTERALDFVGRERGRPFFLYLAYTIPHANNELGRDTGNGMEIPSDAPFTNRDWPQTEKNFAAMVTRLDRDIGRVLDRLQAEGLDRDTLVLFSSDNGPHREGGHNPDFFRSSGPLRGIKRDLYEGGIRVPAIARWPGRVPAGKSSDHPWAFWDFLPTAAEIAGVEHPAGLDGRSFLPALTGKPQPGPEYLYWEFHERGFAQAVRADQWKAVRAGTRAPLELYNLREDPGEKNDVAARHRDLAARMGRVMDSARTNSKDFPIRERGVNPAKPA
jgi:arylsulfatase A-like enzyme